jgi:hypothetical protein
MRLHRSAEKDHEQRNHAGLRQWTTGFALITPPCSHVKVPTDALSSNQNIKLSPPPQDELLVQATPVRGGGRFGLEQALWLDCGTQLLQGHFAVSAIGSKASPDDSVV